MLESNGFAVEKSWWAAPDYRSPAYLVDTTASAVEAARRLPGFSAGRSRVEQLALGAMPAGWLKYFMPGLNFLAIRKEA